MANTFRDRLRASIEATGSLLCVGLDPDPATHTSAVAVERACASIIGATAEFACAFKPNMAFFECHGADGYAVLQRLRSQVESPCLWILDGKRGDIGNTALAYATALFDVLGADAITVNPLMGEDGVQPFLQRSGRGAFLLARTSNAGAADLLTQRLDTGLEVYRHLASRARQWDVLGAHGLVVGATAIDAITSLREDDPEVPLLIPGVGAQGGSLEAAVGAGLDAAGGGILVNVSRAIASDPRGPHTAADHLKQRITTARAAAVNAPLSRA